MAAENVVSLIDSASLWQPLFHIRSLDASAVAVVSSRRYSVSLALTSEHIRRIRQGLTWVRYIQSTVRFGWVEAN